MTEADWNAPFAKSLGVFLNGQALQGVDERGERRTDDSFMILINAHPEPQPWTLPRRSGRSAGRRSWTPPATASTSRTVPRRAGSCSPCRARSVKVLIELTAVHYPAPRAST